MSPVSKKAAARRPPRAAAPAAGNTIRQLDGSARRPSAAEAAAVARAIDSDRAGAPIRTLGLTKEYGDLVAVDRLDLEVRAGEIFGLLGQNGAGKTTTILMLLGLSEPTSGEVRVVGMDPTRNPLAVKARVGYLPDAVGFYGGLTGRENLRFTARLNGLSGPDAEERISAVLGLVRMLDRADTKTETYSRGMLQRLGIADALLKDPDVLILDEPTTSIDPIGVVELLDLMRELVAERQMAILLSSHLLNQVQSVCDRVGIFAAGRLIGIGTVPELAERFGFPPNEIELVLDIGVERQPEVEAILRTVPGVRDVRVAVHAPGGSDTGAAEVDDRALKRTQQRERWIAQALGGRLGTVLVGEAHARENRNPRLRQGDPSNPSIAQRMWVIATDPGQDVPGLARLILERLVAYPLVRIGRHLPALDEIYRRAVSRYGLDSTSVEVVA